uniref:Glycosyltransferase family 61 protein n=1 Tax=Parastrongyloides trichosuri TaxID=131310 RepID=A0A0N4ZAT7_PARTI
MSSIVCCIIKLLSLKVINNGRHKGAIFKCLDFYNTNTTSRINLKGKIFIISLDEDCYVEHVASCEVENFLLYFNCHPKENSNFIYISDCKDFTMVNCDGATFPNELLYNNAITPEIYMKYWPFRWKYFINNYCKLNNLISYDSIYISTMSKTTEDIRNVTLCQVVYKGETMDDEKVIRVWDGTTYYNSHLIPNEYFKKPQKLFNVKVNEDEAINSDLTRTKNFPLKEALLAVDVIIDIGGHCDDFLYDQIEIGDFILLNNVKKSFYSPDDVFIISSLEATSPIVYSVYKHYFHPVLINEFNSIALATQNFRNYISGHKIHSPIAGESNLSTEHYIQISRDDYNFIERNINTTLESDNLKRLEDICKKIIVRKFIYVIKLMTINKLGTIFDTIVLSNKFLYVNDDIQDNDKDDYKHNDNYDEE